MSCAGLESWSGLSRGSFNVLAYLVQHPGGTVTKEELEAQLWPDSKFVDEASLAIAVAKVRKALDGHRPGAAIHPDRPSAGLSLRGADDRPTAQCGGPAGCSHHGYAAASGHAPPGTG